MLTPDVTVANGDVRFHDVEGAHYTMLSPQYVPGFAETLRRALRERHI